MKTASATHTNKRSVAPIPALLLAWLVVFGSAPAQTPPAIQWQQNFGGDNDDFCQVVKQTSDGGYVLGGYSDSGISGNKTSANYGLSDYWVIKVDGNGNKVWENSFGGSNTEILNSLQRTSDGGYILGGVSRSGVSGNKTSANYGSSDYWVIKLDGSGNKVWEKSFGGSGDDELNSLQQTSDGGYILGGDSNSNVSGNKTNAQHYGGSDYWVIKLDGSGNKVWEKSFGGNSTEVLSSLQQTSDGGYILGGHSSSDVSGNKTSVKYGGFDYWVIKLDGSGNKVWEKSFGGSVDDYCHSLQQTIDGGYILGGRSASGVSGNKTSASYGGFYDYWVIKVDGSGNKVWEKSFGGGGTDELSSLQQTSDGGYVLGGHSNSGVSGNYGGFDYWVIKLDGSGNIVWGESFGGSGDDLFSSLQQSIEDGYILGGYSLSGVSGNKTNANYGIHDYWVIKLVGILPSISVQPTNQNVFLGSNATFSVLAGPAPVYYQWLFNLTNVLSGQTNFTLAMTNVSLAQGGTYSVLVSNGSGSLLSSNVSLTVLAPSISAQPVDQTTFLGSNATFMVLADSLVPLYYQWFFNLTNALSGQTNSALALTNVSLAQAGTYSVLVSDGNTSVLSSNAFLTVLDGRDFDGDGIPNYWEQQNGLNPNDPIDANNHPPGDQLTYLQKYLYGLNPLTTDSDGDGLSDYDKLFVYGTNPLKADTDSDGIPDAWEVQHGLNPLVNDANDDLDLDGVSNWQEYQNRALGYRPDRADSFGDGRSDYERLFGTQTNRFYYDRNDRLVGVDYNRGSNGFAIAYVYDGNGNLLRQKNLARDANHNGLPDLWEFLHGLTNNASTYADTDGDYWTDYQEWKAGSNPMDSNSVPGLACVPPPAGLVAWWPGEGNANDIQGANNGALMNGATFTTGKVGQAFSFDGVDDYVVVPDNEAQRPTNITIEGWFKVPSGGQDFILVSKYAGNWAGWTLLLRGTLKPEFELRRQPDQTGVDVPSSVPIPVGQWTHLAGTYDGTNAKIYVNGALQGTTNFPGGYTPSPIQMTIGKASHYGGFAQGQVDEFSIYNRVLTESEISSIYVAGSAGKCTFGAQTVPQTAPLARILPAPSAGGGLSTVRVRLWDAEGNASLPLLQFSPDTTNWFDVTNILTVDGAAYSLATRVQALPGGSEHTLVWNAGAVFPPGVANIFLRARAKDVSLLGNWSEPMPYRLTITLDSDGDGLPDDWEMAAFGNLTQTALGDFDGDGFSNINEYLAGTNPTDPNSSLKLRIEQLPGAVKLSWEGVSNAAQVLQQSFAVPFGWHDVWTNPASTPAVITNILSGTNSFYQLRLGR